MLHPGVLTRRRLNLRPQPCEVRAQPFKVRKPLGWCHLELLQGNERCAVGSQLLVADRYLLRQCARALL